MYLLHADGEVVTEISRRQDQYTRGGLAGYWFPLTYLAVTDRDGRFAAMARQAADGVRLSALLEYPELSQPLPASQPLPTDYEKTFPGDRHCPDPAGSAERHARARRIEPRALPALRRRGRRGRSLRDVVLRQRTVRAGHRREGGWHLRVPPVARGAVLSAAGADDHAARRGPRPDPSADRPRSIASSRWPRSPSLQQDVVSA